MAHVVGEGNLGIYGVEIIAELGRNKPQTSISGANVGKGVWDPGAD